MRPRERGDKEDSILARFLISESFLNTFSGFDLWFYRKGREGFAKVAKKTGGRCRAGAARKTGGRCRAGAARKTGGRCRAGAVEALSRLAGGILEERLSGAADGRA